MKHDVFTIVFFCTNCFEYNDDEYATYRYEAVITVISKSFSLFHAGKIKRTTSDGSIVLSDNYYLTSYPYPADSDYTWKDAVTFYPSKFLDVIGDTIDQYLSGKGHAVKRQRCITAV